MKKREEGKWEGQGKRKKVKEKIIGKKYLSIYGHACSSVVDLLLLCHPQRTHHMEKKAGVIDKSPPKVYNKVTQQLLIYL